MPPKRKKSEVNADLEALQAELLEAEEDGDDVEVWTEHEMNGKQVRGKLTGSHAHRFLDSLFGENPGGTPAKAGAAADDEEEEIEGDPAPVRKSVWGRA